MHNKMIAYIESRVEELGKEADEAKKNGNDIAARVAIEKMIELTRCEIYLNDLEIEETKKKINEIIAKTMNINIISKTMKNMK